MTNNLEFVPHTYPVKTCSLVPKKKVFFKYSLDNEVFLLSIKLGPLSVSIVIMFYVQLLRRPSNSRSSNSRSSSFLNGFTGCCFFCQKNISRILLEG